MIFVKGKGIMKPNYSSHGLSYCMGNELRKEVERQLLVDLMQYNVAIDGLKFDWSDSCIEGKRATYLDGSVENFSGIQLFNHNDEFVAEGWMEFIYEKSDDLFVVYWDFLDIMQKGKVISVKEKSGIPDHIFNRLPKLLKQKYAHERV